MKEDDRLLGAASSADPKDASQNVRSIDLSNLDYADDVKDDGSMLIDKKLNAQEARKMLGDVKVDDPAKDRVSLRLYRRRWLVLCVIALLNNSNTMSWISFASIANFVDEFYGVRKAANWFSMVYLLCTIPVGIFAMYMESKFGLRTTILTAAIFNCVGSSIRLLSSILPIALRFPIGIFGQGLAACAYPFIMFLPPKVAGTWFADNERTLATTIGIMANPLGVLLANIISPQIVSAADHVPFVNIITFVPSLLACVTGLFGVTRSEPKNPPTISAAQSQMSFLPGIKSCFSNKSYILLVFVMGGGIGMFNCLYTVMQQLLCVSGYSNSFSGLCAGLMIIGGVVGATVSGIFVDRTKLYEETMKVGLSLAVLCGLLFLQLTLHPDLQVVLLATSMLFGVFGLAVYPVGLEIASECTFPVSPTTSSGIVVLSGQIQSIIYIALMQMTALPLGESGMKLQVCTKGTSDPSASIPYDNTRSIMAISVVAAVLAAALVALFKPEYRRLLIEQNGRRAEIEMPVKQNLEDGIARKSLTNGEERLED